MFDSDFLNRDLPPVPIFEGSDCCHFCNDKDAGRHGVFLPVRYDDCVICDRCASVSRTVTDCCGILR